MIQNPDSMSLPIRTFLGDSDPKGLRKIQYPIYVVDEKYKYVHLLLHNESKFSASLAMMFNAEENGFDTDNQLIVTPHKEVFDVLEAYGVIYDPLSLHKLVNKY